MTDLSCLPCREFEIHGGQIGDNTSDTGFSSLCKQIDEGLKTNLTESDIIQALLCIVKPGQFNDMLISKDDLTVTELKSFLQPHMSESSSEIFQELMSTRQHENETPQQFLYRDSNKRSFLHRSRATRIWSMRHLLFRMFSCGQFIRAFCQNILTSEVIKTAFL